MTASGCAATSSLVMADEVRSFDQDAGRPYCSANDSKYKVSRCLQ